MLVTMSVRMPLGCTTSFINLRNTGANDKASDADALTLPRMLPSNLRQTLAAPL